MKLLDVNRKHMSGHNKKAYIYIDKNLVSISSLNVPV